MSAVYQSGDLARACRVLRPWHVWRYVRSSARGDNLEKTRRSPLLGPISFHQALTPETFLDADVPASNSYGALYLLEGTAGHGDYCMVAWFAEPKYHALGAFEDRSLPRPQPQLAIAAKVNLEMHPETMNTDLFTRYRSGENGMYLNSLIWQQLESLMRARSSTNIFLHKNHRDMIGLYMNRLT